MTPISGMAVAGRHRRDVRGVARRVPVGPHVLGLPARLRRGCRDDPRSLRDEDLVENAQVTRRPAARRGSTRSPPGRRWWAQVRGLGLLQGLELVADRETLAPLPDGSGRLTAACRERGLMVYSCPTPLGRTTVEAVLLAPPLIVTDDEIDEVAAILGEALAALG